MKRQDGYPPADRGGLNTASQRNWWDQLPITVLAFRRTRKGTRIGFVDLEVPGLCSRIDDCVVHRHPTSGKYWIRTPSRTGEGTGPSGFKDVLRITDKAVARRLSERIVRQLADQYPDYFPDLVQDQLL